MKITRDVRDYAAGLGANEKAALGLDAKTAEAGMKEMSEKFDAMGPAGLCGRREGEGKQQGVLVTLGGRVRHNA
jgi:hypothetical protein